MWLTKVMLPVAVTIFCIIAETSTHRILSILPYNGKSHHLVFEPLLEELADRGHDMTVVSFFPPKVLRGNYRHISLAGLAPISLEVLNLNDFEYNMYGFERHYNHVPLVMNLAYINLNLCEKLLEWPAVQELFKQNFTYDVAITELFNSDCSMGLLHNIKAPVVGLMSSTLLPWTGERMGFPDNPAYVPGMTLGLTDDMTFLERFENAFFYYFYKLWFEYTIRTKEQALMERKFGEKLPPLGEIAKDVSVVLINTHHSLNGARAFVPGVVEVGGMHLKKQPQPLPLNIEKLLNASAKGVILFSMGSLLRSSTMPRPKLEAFLTVLGGLPHDVIMKWEDPSLQGVPSNVHIVRWVPQYDILMHPACVGFITHGGLLSMTEAAHAGVPLLVVPILGDQFGNAAHARAAGLAVELHYGEIDADNLKRAVEQLLSPELRASARRLSKVWSDRPLPPLDAAVYWTERVARLGRDDRLSGRIRHMPGYAVALLDVAAFAVALVSMLLLSVYGVLRFSATVVAKVLCLRKKVKQL